VDNHTRTLSQLGFGIGKIAFNHVYWTNFNLIPHSAPSLLHSKSLDQVIPLATKAALPSKDLHTLYTSVNPHLGRNHL